MKLLRLAAIIILLILYWVTYPWYTISYEILNFNITGDYLIRVLFISYALLEYKLSIQKKANEFYHFIFWFIIIITMFPIYITIIQTFVLNKPVDFLINLQYFKLQINYSIGFLLREMHHYFHDIANLTQDKPMIFTKLLSSIYLNEVLCSVRTLKDLAPLKTFCINLCIYIELYSQKIVTYHLQEQSTFISLISTIKELLTFGALLKITCYSIPQTLFIDFPKYLLKKFLYIPFDSFKIYHLNRFVIQMTRDEFKDFYDAFEPWLLRHYTPLRILAEVIKFYFF